MKYLKTYESINKVYYFIPYGNEELIKSAIKKMSISDSVKENIINCDELFENLEEDIRHGKKIFGCYIIIISINWGFWLCNSKTSKLEALNYFKEEEYTDGGEIKLEDWEIKANQYNL